MEIICKIIHKEIWNILADFLLICCAAHRSWT